MLVTRFGSVTVAAERMSLTQSAVSRLIAELERNVGFELFARVSRGLAPTTQGLEFFRETERSFVGIDYLRQAAKEIRLGFELRLAIACLPALSTTVLPGALDRLHRQRPKLMIDIKTAAVAETVLLLEQRRIDLAVSFCFTPIDGVVIEPVAEAEYVCAVRADHPLAARDCIDAEDLRGETTIGKLPLFPSGFGRTPDPLEGVEESVISWFSCDTSATRCACVAAGLAVSPAEPFTASLYSHHGVVIRPFRPRTVLNYCFAVRSEAQRAPHSLEFRSAFRASLEAYVTGSNLPVTIFQPPD